MTFRQYLKGDLFQVIDKDAVVKFEVPFIDDIDESLSWTATNGNFFVLGCGGFRRYWSGVFEAWLAVKSSDIAYQHKIQMVRFIKQRFKELSAHRIQATISSKRIVDIDFIQYLGFQREGMLRKYGPDKSDYYLYALVK